MAKVMITESYLEDIADAIREKKGGSDTYTPGEMADAISSIDGGGSPTLQTKTKTYTPSASQQTESVTADAGYDGLDEVDITVNATPSATLYSVINVENDTINISVDNTGQILAQLVDFSKHAPIASQAGWVTTTDEVDLAIQEYGSYQLTTKGATTYTPGTTNQTIASGTYLTGAQTISGDANLIAGNIKKDVTIFGTTGTYEGSGGGSSMVVATATKTLTSAASSISFTGLGGEPTSFAITSSTDQTTGGTKVVAVTYDGTNLYGMDITTQATNDTGFSKSYSNGTLTITATTASFQANEYKLVYSYGGTAANIGTEEVQVGSGATSITFTGLEDEPEYFSVIFQSTFSTSSGYQRVMDVVYDGTSDYGNALDSSAKHLTSWSHSYSSGSLTVSSTGTNNGGYFHQPGYYRLIYAIGGDSSLQKKTVTPTGSDQTITADTAQGYTALSQVKVEGVTCSNLTAENIKSGVTVKIGTTTDDDSVTSVTGTYDAGGGGSSLNTQVLQQGATRVASTSYAKACGDLTVSVAGTYDVYWTTYRTSTSGTWGTQLYKNSSTLGAEQTTFSSYYQTVKLTGQVFAKNDVLSVYAKTRGTNYYAYVGQLTIVQTS